MVTVETDCRRAGTVTLVECQLTNGGDEAVRVRLESRLDGPTWPPRADDLPAAGWSDGAYTRRLDPGQTVGVGFASPAMPADQAVHATELDDGGTDSSDGRFAAQPTPAEVVRTLTDPRPTRAALFDENSPGGGRPDGGGATADGGSAANEDPPNDGGSPADGRRRDESPTTPHLGAAADKVERLEALAAVRTLPEATTAVTAEGGLDGVRSLCEAARADRERLLALAGRAERLAGRIEAADVPVEALERLS